MKNKWFVSLGFVIPVIFWLTTLICGFILPGYDHSSRLVSDLGAMGTKSQYIFTTGLVLCSVISILFIISLYKTAKQFGINTFPILVLLTYSFSIGGAGLFPLPLKLHPILGSPSTVLFLSPLSAFILWRKIVPSSKYPSFIIFIVMSFGFLIYIPNFLDNYFGLKQRFFHFGWSIWFCYLSYIFAKILSNPSTILASTEYPQSS